jgi:hypothetical protein
MTLAKSDLLTPFIALHQKQLRIPYSTVTEDNATTAPGHT